MSDNRTPYDLLGETKLHSLIDRFYDKVKDNPLLAPLFPEDFTEVKDKQIKFMTQFLGGPPLFSMEHGPVMLRARHLRFPITDKHAEAWLGCMREAMDETGIDGTLREFYYGRLEQLAYHMVNTHSPS